MHVFNRKKTDSALGRLHSSPSLPNLFNRPAPAPRSPTALRSSLGPLDLAPSKLQPSLTHPASPRQLASLSLSPASSPQRHAVPLTPPLTPSSSLDGGLGLPETPVYEPRSRAVVRDKQGRLVVSLDEDVIRAEAFLEDVPTPTERPYETYYRSKSRPLQVHNSDLSASVTQYLDRDTPPSRFLLIANLPETRIALDRLLGEKARRLVKGIWAGQLSTRGVVVLAFFDVRAAQRARYLWDGSEFSEEDEDGQRGKNRRCLRAGLISLSEAKELTGNTSPSPITEIEDDAAFYVHMQDTLPGDVTDSGSREMLACRGRVESFLASFGTLLAFRPHGRRDGGEWFYVEFFNIQETQAAFQGLSGAPILHELRLTLFPAKSSELPSSLAAPPMVPFPSDSEDGEDTYYPDGDGRSGRPRTQPDSRRSSGRRSASAGPGDGVKAFTGPLASATTSATSVATHAVDARGAREMEERLRMRLAPSERVRSISFDGRDALHDEVGPEESPYQNDYHTNTGYLDYDTSYGGYHYGPQDYGMYGYGYTGDGPYGYQPRYEHETWAPCFAPSAPLYLGPQYTTPLPQTPGASPRHAVVGSPFPAGQYSPSSPYPAEVRRIPRPRRGARLSPVLRTAISPSTVSTTSRGTASTTSSQAISVMARTTRSSPSSASRSSRSTHLSHVSSHDGDPSSNMAENTLNLERIERGLDMRTTVMIKNIPNKMSDHDLLTYISKVVNKRIDFFYLRMDFQNGCNVGYAFVNFITVRDLLTFAQARLGVKWNMYSSEKVLQMSYANYQGKEALVEKFKNSGIMDERESWRPKIFYSSGENQGLPEPFPAPTHQRRKERSAHNRGALFVPGVARAR